MRHCWYQTNESQDWLPGIWHAWSMDSECDGLVFPVGIIEDEKTGQINAIYVKRVRFKPGA